jgi:hypothetical protein
MGPRDQPRPGPSGRGQCLPRPATIRIVIRNAVIHITNEQPLMVDLFDMPTAADVGLICTNVRGLDGKKPIFVDHSNSIFVFPYDTIRFLEILAGAATGYETAPDESLVAGSPDGAADGADAEADLELDEEFLRKIRDV